MWMGSMRVVYNVGRRGNRWVCWKFGTSRVSRIFDSRPDAMIYALSAALRYDYIVRVHNDEVAEADEYNNSQDRYADYRRIIFTLNNLLLAQQDIMDIIEPLVGLS